MIGGQDVVFPAVGDSATLDECARIVRRFWPQVRFEDAITGDKYRRLDEIPFGKICELLAYPDARAEAAWDAGLADAPENSMLCLIVRPEDITVVLDNPHTAVMQSLLDMIHSLLRNDMHLRYARAA